MTIATIQDQIALLEEKESRLLEQDKIDENELNIVRNRLSELRYTLGEQQQFEQAKQVRIETALTETAVAVDNMDIDGMSLRDLCIDEQAYQFVKIAFQSMLNAKDTKYIEELAVIQAGHKEELRAAAEREANLIFQVRAKEQVIDELNNEAVEYRKLINTLEFERDQAHQVRDNAAAEIEGYKLAVAEKQEQIDKLRAEIAVGAKEAVKVDQTEQLRQAKEAFLASRIKVTNIRWTDPIKQREYNAELVTTGETITFNRLEKGKYLEVTAEEAERFRAEAHAAAEVAVTTEEVQHIPLVEAPVVLAVEPVEQFRTEETEVLLPGSDNDTVPGAMAEQTLEEAFRRIEILERKVSEIVG